ncbi:MAG: hypothetical protein GY792_34780, partial [Gammaproteobacteria bacterium]|nr:hypothetical protein [Gammaproteobacteria bacterium]
MWSTLFTPPKAKLFSAGNLHFLLTVLMLSMITRVHADILLTKSFTDDPVTPGGTVTLEFTLTNDNPDESPDPITFTDDLDAVISGMVATTNLPISPVSTCGAGSEVEGPSVLVFSGGALSGGASCDFSVTLSIPETTTPGNYNNTTTGFTWGVEDIGEVEGTNATDTLAVIANPVPGFSKSFAPNPIAIGGSSTLTFSIDNSASSASATDLDFSDNLPTGTEVANPTNASTNCTGGAITAVAGSSSISYTGGTVAESGTCNLSVDVTGTSAGSHNNTSGDLTS